MISWLVVVAWVILIVWSRTFRGLAVLELTVLPRRGILNSTMVLRLVEIVRLTMVGRALRARRHIFGTEATVCGRVRFLVMKIGRIRVVGRIWDLVMSSCIVGPDCSWCGCTTIRSWIVVVWCCVVLMVVRRVCCRLVWLDVLVYCVWLGS